jgi:myosin heavy subunit
VELSSKLLPAIKEEKLVEGTTFHIHPLSFRPTTMGEFLDNLANLTELNEDTILAQLKGRYDLNKIYVSFRPALACRFRF